MGVLDGKVAVVTGGASGIGLASTRRLAAAGATVVVVDLAEDAGEAAAAAVGGSYVRADVGEPSEWERIVSTALDAYGGIHVAHLNAGVITLEGDVTRISDDAYRRIMRVNVDGVFFGLRALAPVVARSGGGAIVATASLAGLIAYAPDPVYGLTKHAVVGLVRAAAPQLAEQGVTLNAVCPGIVDTPMVGEVKSAIEAAGFPLIPADDIAEAVLVAATSGATGQAYVCQAGREPVPFEFRGVPGPRLPGAEGARPPEGMGDPNA